MSFRRARQKAVHPMRQRSDMSIIIDAAGGLGSSFAPHFAVSGKGEPERHRLHKIKSTFTKIHGLGTSVFVTNSNLEKEGSNLVLESLYKCIETFLKERDVTYVRNLYVQLDNTPSNKSWALIAGCAALIVLGLVRKVKLSYCLVGHTHEDIDAMIGTVVSYLRGRNLPNFEAYATAVCLCCMPPGIVTNAQSYFVTCRSGTPSPRRMPRYSNVVVLTGLPDYEAHFSGDNFNTGNAVGILACQEIRLSMKDDGSDIQVHYRPDCTQQGWYPRPVLPTAALSSTWKDHFVSKDPTQGYPVWHVCCSCMAVT